MEHKVEETLRQAVMALLEHDTAAIFAKGADIAAAMPGKHDLTLIDYAARQRDEHTTASLGFRHFVDRKVSEIAYEALHFVLDSPEPAPQGTSAVIPDSLHRVTAAELKRCLYLKAERQICVPDRRKLVGDAEEAAQETLRTETCAAIDRYRETYVIGSADTKALEQELLGFGKGILVAKALVDEGKSYAQAAAMVGTEWTLAQEPPALSGLAAAG